MASLIGGIILAAISLACVLYDVFYARYRLKEGIHIYVWMLTTAVGFALLNDYFGWIPAR